MTTKKQKHLDRVWRELHDCVEHYNGYVSAGQVGQWMGITRNTAKTYLEELIAAGGAEKLKRIGKNHQEIILYSYLTAQSE